MKAAKERGMNNFLFFTNSAPYFMTRSGATVSTDRDYINLQEDKFDDFARFLVNCTKHFREQGYEVNYISPINEPNVEWHTNPRQEGSFATKADVYRMVKELDKAIEDEQVKAKILIPELGEMKCLFEVDTTANMPDDIIRSMVVGRHKSPYQNIVRFKMISAIKKMMGCTMALMVLRGNRKTRKYEKKTVMR